MKRCVVLTSLVLSQCLLSASAVWAVNSVVVESKTVNKGQAGVSIAIRITNDVPLVSVVLPLALRQVSGGAFVTALQPLYGERLPAAGGALSDISVVNQYADEDGISCKEDQPGGFGTIAFDDGASHPVANPPEGLMFARASIAGAKLLPGSDAVGSMSLLVSVTTAEGAFEIDTTCTDPSNHVAFVQDDPSNTLYVPDFTKGVINVGHPPVARDTSWTTNEDTPRPVSYLPASDLDADPLTFSINTGPQHGVITGFVASSGAFTYTPEPNYNGPDSIKYAATDGTLTSNIGTVRITVSPVNDAPVARDTIVTTDEDTPVNALFHAYDVDGDPLTFTRLSGPFHGIFSAFNPASGAFTYTPASNYNGPDSITFRARDAVLNSNTATVRITVIPVNDAPVARDTLVTTNKNVPVPVRFQSFDIDGGPAWPTYSRLTGPFNGIFTEFDPSAGTFLYSPDTGYTGADSITFDVSDGLATSNVGTVRINVIADLCYCPHEGDPTMDGVRNVLDVVDVIDVVFKGHRFPIYPPCLYAYEDLNCDCSVNVLDVVKMINVVFRSDRTPPCDICAAACM